MNRIKEKFADLRHAGRKALIPYLTPEFPLKGATVPLLQALERSDADLIEVGVPFSDPLADGKTIQHSSEVALRNGVTIPLILGAVRQFRASSVIPVLLMGYMNPILRYGMKKFLADCVAAGVDGLIVPDLPPEEGSDLVNESKNVGISNVFLIAPTTPADRIRVIDRISTDFSYCVSVTGVTGVRTELGVNGSLDGFLQRVKANTQKPFVVGFGISTREHVQRVWAIADGAVVGSALLQAINDARSIEEAAQHANDCMVRLRS